MYEGCFKLQGRPFLAAPDVSRYFPATMIDHARKTLARCIERGEGPGLIVGPSGTGKSLLCEMLADEFQGRFEVVVLAAGRLSTRQALLQAILYELGLPYRGLDEGELRLALLDHLRPSGNDSEGLLLVVDEAHALPCRLLEEVRMLTNLVRDGRPRVRAVLAGNPLLEERFASPKLSSFSQRLAARCYLESLDATETAAYAQAQIAMVGGDPLAIFDEDALRSIYRATDGIPRLINQVCDHALILAGLGGLERLTGEAIEEAWADLQQLPTPWIAKTDGGGAGIVEFGGLDEMTDEMPEAIPFRAPKSSLHLSRPDEQLDAIQEQLAHVDDDDFEAAGSIGTEVELVFPDFGDPFAEEFAEEEVIIDPYGSEAEIFADVPRVNSWEGRELGAMSGPMHTSTTIGADYEPTMVKIEPSDPADGGPRTFWPSSGEWADEALMADLIVVEDKIGANVPPPHPDPKGGKREYRQLFARLRRG